MDTHATRTRDRYGTNAAWAALIAEHPTHASTLRRLAAGTTTTAALPAALASEAVQLATTTDQLAQMTGGRDHEQRRTVDLATRERRSELVEDVRLHLEPDEIAALIGGLSQRDVIRRYIAGYDRDTLSAVAALLAARQPAHRALRQVAAFLAAHAGTVDLEPNLDPEHRAIIVAGAAIARRPLDPSCGTTIADHIAAARHCDDAHQRGMPDLDPSRGTHPATRHAVELGDLAANAYAHPGCTVDDLAAIYSVDHLSDLTRTEADLLTARWHDRWPVTTDGTPIALDDLLVAITADGTLTYHDHSSLLAHTTTQLPYRVAVACLPEAPDNAAFALLDHLAGVSGRHWDIDEIDAVTPPGTPLRTALIAHIAARRWTAINDELVDDALRAHGLAPWIAANTTSIVERLNAAAAAANYTIDDWELLWAQLPGFAGTPEELVDALDAVRPHH